MALVSTVNFIFFELHGSVVFTRPSEVAHNEYV